MDLISFLDSIIDKFDLEKLEILFNIQDVEEFLCTERISEYLRSIEINNDDLIKKIEIGNGWSINELEIIVKNKKHKHDNLNNPEIEQLRRINSQT